MKKNCLVLFILMLTLGVNAQNIFKEKFVGCNTDEFMLESDTTIARVGDKEFIDVVTSGFDPKVGRNIEGILILQIIVDSEGNSCLLSIDNKTNRTTNELNLKSTIDNNLKWNKPKHKVSAIVKLLFRDSNVTLKRFGTNTYLGWYEITDKIIPKQYPQPKPKSKSENNPQIYKDKKTNSIWKLYNTNNSVIPYDMSRAVAMDTCGAIWYCTDEGIVKIDDDKWTVFTGDNSPLPKNKYGRTITTGLTVDKQNRVWVESFGNVIMYDGKSWIKYDTLNSKLKSVNEISVDRNGIVWFGTYYGLVKYDGKIWTKYDIHNSQIPSNDVSEVFLDRKNILWVGTDKGLVTYKDNKWFVYNTNNSSLPSNSVSSVKGDNYGNIWIGTNEKDNKGGLVKIDSLNQWTVYSKTNSPLPCNTIWNIAIEDKIVWLANISGGLVRFDGTNWEIYNSTNSIIPNNYVSAIGIDRKGQKWVATFAGLVFTNR